MKSKKKAVFKRTILLILAAVIIVISLFAYYFLSRKDCIAIKINWGISLFNCDKDLYHQDSGPSFLGDGDYLTVLQFHDFVQVSNIVNWKEGSNAQIKTEVADAISRLKITNKYKPNLNMPYKYYTRTQYDNSTIYLIYNMQNNYLYIVENIM